jgi:hypothetical protein
LGEGKWRLKVSDAEDGSRKPASKDDRQFLFWGWADQVEGGPIFFQRAFKEKLDAADGDGGRAAGVMFDVLDLEEVLAQLFLGDQVG